ncbi:hypothetical protein M8C21_024350, partial [Ambrosia artemisiifolia]
AITQFNTIQIRDRRMRRVVTLQGIGAFGHGRTGIRRKYESRSEQWWWLEFFELLVWGEEAPKPAQKATQSETPAAKYVTTAKPDVSKQTPVGIHGNPSNGYFSADGQNTCNLIMERPSTKVHSAPGGGSSLGYLFGGGAHLGE